MIRKLGLSIVDSVLGLGLLSMAFWVGTQSHMITNHETRISSVETRGSASLQALETKHDIEMIDMRRRLSLLETVVVQVTEIKAQLSGISVQISNVQEQLKRHEDNTRQMIQGKP